MDKPLSALLLAALLCLMPVPLSAHASVTLLIPSQPNLEPADQPDEEQSAAERRENKKEAPKSGQTAAAAPAAGAPTAAGAATPPSRTPEQTDPAAPGDTPPEGTEAAAAPAAPEPEPGINQEVDLLMTRMDPFRHLAEEMSMPQLFAVLRFDDRTPSRDGAMQPERVDLLGDVEEAQYLDKKAWGANVALDKPGLYQFIIETRPWWNEAAQRYDQHYVKSFLPVFGVESGWEHAAGLPVEIVPLSRPFGLSNPALFSGRVLDHGKPRAGTLVRAQRINLETCPVPSRWHEDIAVRTNERGEFALVLNRPGWWCCTAIMEGTPLKGNDGDPRPLQIGSSVWVYVDAADGQRPAQPQPAKKKKNK